MVFRFEAHRINRHAYNESPATTACKKSDRATEMIVSFKNRRTKAFDDGKRIVKFSALDRSASSKLDQLDAAAEIGDLTRPGNRLEALKGQRSRQWSIRVNDQWRICFNWPASSSGPTNVEIVDYH